MGAVATGAAGAGADGCGGAGAGFAAGGCAAGAACPAHEIVPAAIDSPSDNAQANRFSISNGVDPAAES